MSDLRVCEIFIVVGEMSGDELGAEFLIELYRRDPHIKVTGIGGPKMREVGLTLLFPMENLELTGIVKVIHSLPSAVKWFKKTIRGILEANPKVVVTIDYPDFNLRLAKHLKKRGFKGKICHYVCPSIWAWKKNRKYLMIKYLDLLLSILPFEKNYFLSTSLRVEYIGYPITAFTHFKKLINHNLLMFFPGSRAHEIKRHLPFFAALIEKLKKEFPQLKYVMSLSQEKYRPLFDTFPFNEIKLVLPSELKTLEKPFLAIAKCGTIALKLACYGIPSIIVYAMPKIDILLAKYLFKISLPFYALPNLILNEAIFPELIANQLSEKSLLQVTRELITNRDAAEKCRSGCQKVTEQINAHSRVGGNRKAVDLILELKASYDHLLEKTAQSEDLK